MTVVLTHVLVINSDLSATELVVIFWVVRESEMPIESSRKVEDMLGETCVSTVVSPVEPTEKFIPVALVI